MEIASYPYVMIIQGFGLALLNMGNVKQQSGLKNERVSSREYFLTLLPSLSADFLRRIECPIFEGLSPNIQFPFHAKQKC